MIGRGDDKAMAREMGTEEGRLPPVSAARVAIENEWVASTVSVRVAYGCLM